MSDDVDEERGSVAGAPPSGRDEGATLEGVLGLDHVYGALSHPRRRYLCYTLLEDEEWSLAELARRIAAWEDEAAGSGAPGSGAAGEATPESRWERVYVALYHAHVPKLVEMDVVAFDEETGTVTPAGNAEQVLDALRGVGGSVDASQESHARDRTDDGAR
jgi:hypothetical protein